MATWRKLIEETAYQYGDRIEDMSISIEDGGLDREFYDGYGHEDGCSFTAWSKTRVYFPLCYDGSEWCGSAPRNPCDERLSHQGR